MSGSSFYEKLFMRIQTRKWAESGSRGSAAEPASDRSNGGHLRSYDEKQSIAVPGLGASACARRAPLHAERMHEQEATSTAGERGSPGRADYPEGEEDGSPKGMLRSRSEAACAGPRPGAAGPRNSGSAGPGADPGRLEPISRNGRRSAGCRWFRCRTRNWRARRTAGRPGS